MARMRDDRTHPFGELVEGLFRKQRKGASLTVTRLRQHWGAIVGAGLARATRPTRVVRGVLWVATVDSGWAFNLQFVKADMLDAVQTYLGSEEVRELRFRVGDVDPPAEAGAPPEETGAESTAAESPTAESTTPDEAGGEPRASDTAPPLVPAPAAPAPAPPGKTTGKTAARTATPLADESEGAAAVIADAKLRNSFLRAARKLLAKRGKPPPA